MVSVWSDFRQCSRSALLQGAVFLLLIMQVGLPGSRGRRTGQDLHHVIDMQYTASRRDYSHASLRRVASAALIASWPVTD